MVGLGRTRCPGLEIPHIVHCSLDLLLRWVCGIGHARPRLARQDKEGPMAAAW